MYDDEALGSIAPTSSGTYRCSFYGKGADEVEDLIAGTGGVYICDECVGMAMNTIIERRAQRAAEAEAGLHERRRRVV